VAKVEVCYAQLCIDESRHITATELRGCLGYLFIEDTEFHHHMDNPYHYPLIQYKKIGITPTILGLGQYSEILFRNISRIEKIITKEGISKVVTSIELKRQVAQIGKADQEKYRFISPWLALNKENYRRFLCLDHNQKENLLKKILTGNILSMLKGLGIFIDYRIEITTIQHTIPFLTHAHGNTFWGLKPEFTTNITIPRHIGLGKSVSKGFGTVDFIDS
jgi:hypothetical protein